jgi:hypothetical protein
MCWPHIPFRIIDEVNRSIDNPDKKMIALQQSGVIDPKAMDLFKLNKSAGHRKYNHTIPSAFLSAYQISPKYAADLAIVHLLADRMSNYMHDAMGSESKEVQEALINKNYALFRETSGFKRNKRRKMYFE